jgi:DNA-binding XRE family transcriptional regulator
MAKIKLESFRKHIHEKLKDKEFRKQFEFERAKVALVQKLTQLRESSGLKQVDLAKRMEVSQQFISQIETAKEKNLTLETLLKIARSLGRNVEISFPKSTSRDSYLKVA